MFCRANTQTLPFSLTVMLTFYRVKTFGSKIRKSFHEFRKQDCLTYVCKKPWKSAPELNFKKKKLIYRVPTERKKREWWHQLKMGILLQRDSWQKVTWLTIRGYSLWCWLHGVRSTRLTARGYSPWWHHGVRSTRLTVRGYSPWWRHGVRSTRQLLTLCQRQSGSRAGGGWWSASILPSSLRPSPCTDDTHT